MEHRSIMLIPAEPDHEADYRKWFNDFQVQRTSGMLPMPWSASKFHEWFSRRVIKTDDAVWFSLVDNDSGRLVGFSGVRDIDYMHRTAEFFITIGEAAARGRGVGTDATSQTLNHAFNVLGLHSILLDVSSASLAGIRAYEKAGFREIGRRTEAVRMGGRLYDWVYMECLSTKFRSPAQGR
jgi:diamine N-acetyltransferase